ncbi:hypothetical protein [Paenibacillus sp. NEAU-GSW1]|uniref:hypothetical protein n=1 Tax=Paenibacillus sp. NEAU-GSW1 TaxID=2682486 RepID=UPI0012E176C9|nr:hypothetical protein [Paenibacillus sp. NEAU-GSW1]MUT65197.1 hypothetical protein [Paenibacillus sp. NEAU-GSW1]
MKKTITILLLAAALLTACGQGGNGTKESATEEHGGHGGHKEKEGSEAGHEAPAAGANEDVEASFSYSDTDNVQANKETTVTIQIQAADGKPYEQFETVHEKKLHLIVVSKDLSYFNHIHPEYEGNGKFTIETAFPAAGDYKLIADFTLTGSEATNRSSWLTVKGEEAAAVPIVPYPEAELTQTVDGKQVELSFDQLTANKELMLNFNISDAETKQPITDLQPYLGAIGHVVILSEDAENYLHVHPMEEKGSGPEAKFMTTFPHSGIYKIWGQFQRDGKVFTVPFVVEVP